MSEEPRVEQAEHAAGPRTEPVDSPPEPLEEDWLEGELPPDDQTGVDWKRAAVIAAFIAVTVGIAVFFVWTYLLPSASTGM
jgi:hypothetical protein